MWRPVGHQGAQGPSLRPSTPPQLRHVGGNRIVEGELTLSVEDRQRRRHHRLGEQADPEPGGRRHRARGSHVFDTAVRRDRIPAAEDPERRSGDPVRRRMSLKDDCEGFLVQGPSVVGHEMSRLVQTPNQQTAAATASTHAMPQGGPAPELGGVKAEGGHCCAPDGVPLSFNYGHR
jgi:hypothetical protein